jgi:urate oxidase
MPVVLTTNTYGKSQVRLTRITRRPDRQELTEWTVDVLLEGDFAAAYTVGDNRRIVATDTMKNRVYVLAADAEFDSPEAFALRYTGDFLNDYPQVTTATVRVAEDSWHRIAVDGKPHPHAFVAGNRGKRTCSVTRQRSGCRVQSGIDSVPVLKTTDSAFRDFHRDQYTTLPDTDDRILATLLTAEWTYTGSSLDWNAQLVTATGTLMECFANHWSLGVQQTLHAMGSALLEKCPDIEEISITMPNRHRLPVNMQPFGRPNRNEVFVTTDEPSGLISGTLRRA